MQNNVIDLTKLLAEHKLLAPGVTISAKIAVTGFGYAPVVIEKEGSITSVNETGVNAMFDGQKHRHAKFEDILTIEGMDILRFAQAYLIKAKARSKKK